MFTLIINRNKVDLHTGAKKQVEIFRLTHKYSRVPNQILQHLFDNDALEGGDVVTCIRGKKTVNKYSLCLICCKQPAINNNKCRDCNKSIKQTVGVEGDKVLLGIIEAIKFRRAESANQNHEPKSHKNNETLSPAFSHLRQSFQ